MTFVREEQQDVRSRSRLTDAEVLATAEQLVDRYLVFLQRQQVSHAIFDTTRLPASKLALENAFRLGLATELRSDMRRKLYKAAMTLSRYHANIGAPIQLKPAFTSDEERELQQDRKPDDAEAIDIALARVDLDMKRLSALFRDAARIAEVREAAYKASNPMQADGTYHFGQYH